MAQRPFNGADYVVECRRMSGVREGMQERLAFSVGEVQLTTSTIGNVSSNDA